MEGIDVARRLIGAELVGGVDVDRQALGRGLVACLLLPDEGPGQEQLLRRGEAVVVLLLEGRGIRTGALAGLVQSSAVSTTPRESSHAL